MADSKITQLVEDTTPLSTDLTISVDDPAGSPVNKKVQLQNLITKAHGLSNGLMQVESGVMTSGNSVDDITISEIDKIVASSANVVDVFLYDTTKDSDKGAWRKRCQHLSWYVQNGEIHALSDIIVDGGAGDLVSMYDITVSTTPLWDSWVVTNPSSVEMLNGQMVVGTDSGALVFSFLENKVYRYNATNLSVANQDIKDFNHGTVSWSTVSTDPIVNVAVNDVAISIGSDAPIDILTGLQVPTIAIATGGGTSVINNDGTVSDSVTTSSVNFVGFSGSGDLGQIATDFADDLQMVSDYSADGFVFGSGRQYYTGSTPATLSDTTKGAQVIPGGVLIGHNIGITTLHEDTISPANGMVNYTTAEYISGWMAGDIRGAWLADSDDTDVVGSELVTNGTFATDTDWTKGTGWTIAAGVASSDGTQVADSLLTTSTVPTTVASTDYIISFEVTAYTAGNVALKFDGSEVIADKAATGVYFATVTASDTTGTIDVVADLDFVGSVDNVTLRLAEADRSVNNNGLAVYGTITKNPVA